MNKRIEISASILSANFANLAQDVKMSEDAAVDRFHIDCMDGHFVPNLTIGPIIIQALRPYTKLLIEAHLMIEHPWDYIESYAQAGADVIQIQVECYGHRRSACSQYGQWPKEVDAIDIDALRRDLQKIRKLGKKAYIVINPGTPLFKEILPDCDGVLLMSVNPGFAGQKFISTVLPKIEYLKNNFKGDIAIDGGINALTAPVAVNAGAKVLITASYFYGSSNRQEVVHFLKGLGE
ncbi:MAG: ribulose-phosphate 3-epimerase [Candidatus Omnitrophota bacterium]